MRGNSDRCPTHPGQYLREEGIPGVRKIKGGKRASARSLAQAPERHPGRMQARHPLGSDILTSRKSRVNHINIFHNIT